MYLLYSLLFAGLFLLAIPYLVYRSLRDEGYAASVLERFRVPDVEPSDKDTIWIHAVSVGEVIAAATFLPAFEKAFPDARFVVSVITVTGRRVAEDKLGRVDAIFYCPFDVRFLVRRVVRAVKPRALLVAETEIWPHLLRESRRAGAAAMMVAGRISDRSFPRYQRVRPFMRAALAEIDRFCMQSELYAERIRAMGAPPDRVRVTGSVKFDVAPAETGARVFPEGRKILIAGSTLDPEEKALLEVFDTLRKTTPELFLVLAPRHPHRFDEAVSLAKAGGRSVVRRSEGGGGGDVMVLDTLGELAARYGEADYVFVGGSLADWGGHNIIEPASMGKPVAFGPHMRNFADIAALFLEAKAAVQVRDSNELVDVVRGWIDAPETAHALSENARRVIEEQRGASEKTAAALAELLS